MVKLLIPKHSRNGTGVCRANAGEEKRCLCGSAQHPVLSKGVDEVSYAWSLKGNWLATVGSLEGELLWGGLP